ncbi:MAG: HAD family hydrolase [Campylobacterota bacterium]|nr:HAD family hydrolase [Campylobacterota bacterium]
MIKKQLIIFDMDGTLIDSGNVIANTINFVRTNIGLDKLDKEDMLLTLNNPDINAAEFFYGTSAFTDEQTVLFTKYYDENCIKDIILYDGIKQMLELLSEHFILTVATNASVDFANKMCEHLDIDKYFDMVVGASCVQNPKPHPDMLLKILNHLNISKDEAILIGDSLKDKKAANCAQIDSILVNWGFSNHCDSIAVNNSKELTKRILKFT